MFQKKKLNVAIASVLAASFSGAAAAKIEEVTVTATKRAQKMEDIPVAVQALTDTAMSDLGVQNFSDYLVQLPGVTAGGSGPGQNTIYIRGVASTTPNLTTAGVAGLSPNVALYLDEQPLEQPGRNLDVYTADLARIEVLSGPQGTLFGASSQAGTIRLITNKPDPTGTYAKLKMGTSWTKSGDMSNNVTGVVNIPVTDKLAMRGVVFSDNRGGYIDNVPGTIDASQSARFRPAGTMRSNGVPVSSTRAGFQSTSDLSGVTFLKADNKTMAKPNFNDSSYAGGRLSGLYSFNDDWNLLIEHMEQNIKSEGVFFADPNLGDDLEIQRYSPDNLEDYFHNTAWTLNGKIGDLEALYTGAFTRRRTDQTIDYTDYLFVGQYLPYYICDGSVTYPGSAAPSGTCQPPNLSVISHSATKVLTSEVRFNTPIENPLRATFGAFYRDMSLKERNDFNYPGSTRVDGYGVQTGFSPNYPFMTGYTSDPGPFPPGVIFRNDVKRTDKDLGVYGEATYDFSDQLSMTLGARWYDIQVDLEGSANSSFCNLFQPDVNAYGTDISDIYNGDGQVTFHGSCNPADHITYTQANAASAPAAVQAALNAPDKAKTDGVIGKATLSYKPNQAQLWYVTWSQGFRPGLLNRPGGAQGPNGYTVPFALDTDDVTNYELGWKLNLLDYNLQFNGSAFWVDISKLQTTIFDPSIVNLFFSDNAADARVKGVEGNFIYTPQGISNLTISGSFSFLNTEITKVLVPTNDVRVGDELAFAPKFQGSLRARYTWPLDSGLTAHFMPYVTYSAKSYSDVITINRDVVDSWAMLGFTLGVSASQWTAELYVDNLTDERAELSSNYVFDRRRVSYARPLNGGVRLTYNF